MKNRYAFGGYDIVEQKLYFLAKIKNNSIVKLNINNIIDEVIKESYGSGIYIEVGEELTLRDLLYGLMLKAVTLPFFVGCT